MLISWGGYFYSFLVKPVSEYKLKKEFKNLFTSALKKFFKENVILHS